MAQEDSERYQNEMSSLQLNGYFINSDGVKSTDVINEKKE